MAYNGHLISGNYYAQFHSTLLKKSKMNLTLKKLSKNIGASHG